MQRPVEGPSSIPVYFRSQAETTKCHEAQDVNEDSKDILAEVNDASWTEKSYVHERQHYKQPLYFKLYNYCTDTDCEAWSTLHSRLLSDQCPNPWQLGAVDSDLSLSEKFSRRGGQARL